MSNNLKLNDGVKRDKTSQAKNKQAHTYSKTSSDIPNFKVWPSLRKITFKKQRKQHITVLKRKSELRK